MQIYKIKNTRLKLESRIFHLHKIFYSADVKFEGRIASISDATGASYSLIPQNNSAGNFVKVEQRIPVRIEFTENNRPEDLQRLRAGMNVECYVKQ